MLSLSNSRSIDVKLKSIEKLSLDFSFHLFFFLFFSSPRILTRDGDARPTFERLPSRGIRERIARRVTNPCRHLSVHLRADGRRASASSAAISPRDAILSRDRKISARNETGFAQMSMKCQTHAAHVDWPWHEIPHRGIGTRSSATNLQLPRRALHLYFFLFFLLLLAFRNIFS